MSHKNEKNSSVIPSAEGENDGIGDLLQGTLCIEREAEAPKFKAELANTPFSIFKPIRDYGFFEWKPTIDKSKSLEEVTSDEIHSQINMQGRPPLLIDTSTISLPHSFSSLPPQEHVNKYPHSQYDIAGLYVATQVRGLQKEEVDFVFGGSTLAVLANKQTNDKNYLATKVAGTNMILVVKNDEYVQNYSDKGFQFEQLVTGKTIQERKEISFVEHMHLMQVANSWNVLFLAEVDAFHKNEPVEITASNPHFWGTDKVFQCLSNGSPRLCHGSKRRGNVSSIEIKPLSQLAREALATEDVAKMESNIKECMEAISMQIEAFEPGTICKLSFSSGKAKLISLREPTCLLVPSEEVVWDLLN